MIGSLSESIEMRDGKENLEKPRVDMIPDAGLARISQGVRACYLNGEGRKGKEMFKQVLHSVSPPLRRTRNPSFRCWVQSSEDQERDRHGGYYQSGSCVSRYSQK